MFHITVVVESSSSALRLSRENVYAALSTIDLTGSKQRIGELSATPSMLTRKQAAASMSHVVQSMNQSVTGKL
jgi:hypothetical protein